jgi:hypothetical protein
VSTLSGFHYTYNEHYPSDSQTCLPGDKVLQSTTKCKKYQAKPLIFGLFVVLEANFFLLMKFCDPFWTFCDP